MHLFYSYTIDRKVNNIMSKLGMEQKCVSIKEVGNGNWKEYMWPHQVEKSSETTGHLPGPGLNGVTNININHGNQGVNCVNSTVSGNTFNIK